MQTTTRRHQSHRQLRAMRRLAPLVQSLDIWETEYLHVLTGEDPAKEWVKALG